AARAPMVLDQMPGDALDAHERTASHQLPEAPPPPKLPPPPEKPLSLELQPLLLPPEKPPDQPLPRPRPDCRAAFWLAAMMPSAKKVNVETMPPSSSARAIEPNRYQPRPPTTMPAVAEPSRRPSRLRQIAPIT